MDPEEFKRRMRVARANGGLRSQEELAERLIARGTIRGLARATLDKIENGRQIPNDDQLRVIAAACAVPMRYLTDEGFDPFAPRLVQSVTITGDTATVTNAEGVSEVMTVWEAQEKGYVSDEGAGAPAVPVGTSRAADTARTAVDRAKQVSKKQSQKKGA